MRAEGAMDVNRILIELREERRRVEEAILSLQRLSVSHGKKRGRPPKWLVEARELVSLEEEEPES
jgi:hypothetical protein